MNNIYAMRRANGDWFALKKLDGLRVPVFYDETEAVRARLRFVNTELYDGDIGFRKDMAQHGPCPVIQTPTRI
jgi:hypothetical protein